MDSCLWLVYLIPCSCSVEHRIPLQCALHDILRVWAISMMLVLPLSHMKNVIHSITIIVHMYVHKTSFQSSISNSHHQNWTSIFSSLGKEFQRNRISQVKIPDLPLRNIPGCNSEVPMSSCKTQALSRLPLGQLPAFRSFSPFLPDQGLASRAPPRNRPSAWRHHTRRAAPPVRSSHCSAGRPRLAGQDWSLPLLQVPLPS